MRNTTKLNLIANLLVGNTCNPGAANNENGRALNIAGQTPADAGETTPTTTINANFN